MSTKNLIASGKQFEIYTQFYEPEKIYLVLKGVDFEASPSNITICLNQELWELIRSHSTLDLTWADATDEEILQYIKSKINDRNKIYSEATEERKKFAIRLNQEILGDFSLSEEEQIENGVFYYHNLRSQQLKVKEALDIIKQENLE
ncbi:hypothetical protein PCC7424_5808 (plasmid) [Gloeothece citriformis PCC 7424]|uniref:Uncharacterized protein n=1 Tax=Gloeothece citriformis (strain PCC 7424) TaxID=65393 RepID=B7KM47_GLOC7|nr:hypothetical protein [Gloeothece citriformis]ACK73869.1 hypothetical protein PCC7424_5808 [Gloeothece citriformis PCC 7424]